MKFRHGGSVAVCALLAACDDARPGWLGDHTTAIDTPGATVSAAAAPPAPQPDAGPPDAGQPAVSQLDAGQHDAGVAAPATPPAAGSAPPAPSMQPTTAPPAQPQRSPDYVAVATEAVEELSIGIEQYVCTLTELMIPEDTWVTAIEVVPQHREYTFRASVMISEGQACDGLGLGGGIVFDYYPDQPRLELKQGDALFFPARSYINVQLHHSGLAATAPSTDHELTKVRLWTLPQGERPTHRVMRAVYHALNITVPVGAVDQHVSTSMEIDERYMQPGAEIIGISPGMHFLGQSVTASVIATDGTETSFFDLQDWSIGSRKDYLFDASKYLPIERGMIHKQTCVYSNRPEDQALDASGRPMTPVLTAFGEDARNEICRMNVLYRYPI